MNSHFKFKAILLISLLSGVYTMGIAETHNSVQASPDTTSSTKVKNFTGDNFNIGVNLKNMHTWHGSVVTPGAMIATSLEYKTADDKFTAGLWGGASFNGDYKEFSYYTSYQFTNNFKTSLISHNNYSNSENPNIFSYDKYTSPNFVDIVLEYTVSESFPLNVYWSTILFGNGGDFEEKIDGEVNNSYSTYVQLTYDLISEDRTKLSVFTGGAFSPTTEKTFYSESANIVNIGIQLDKKINIFNHDLPVSTTAFWNPETKIGVLQLDINLF